MQAVISNGKKYVKINPWDPDDTPEAWVGTVKAEDSRKFVPVLYAAWQLRGKAMGDLPFCIYKGDTEVDNSDDYKNVVGWLTDPYLFMQKAELALCGYGKCYHFIEQSRSMVKALRYMAPTSIDYEIDTKKWLPKYFERTTGTAQKIKYAPEDVNYIWLPDPDVEVGEPLVFPFKAAMIVASSLDAVNRFIADYAGRGMTKMFLLAMKGNPPAQEKERIESWWNSFWNKVSVRWKVFNAEAIEPTVIGDGLEALRGTEVTRGMQEQILAAMGVPTSLVLADAANYATAEQDVRTFYTNTIMPDARVIQAALNVQVLEPKGYHLEFEPQRLEAFQIDESERATALSSLAGTLTNSTPESVSLSMSILNYQLTDEQQNMLDAMIEAKNKAREEMAQQLQTPPEEKPDEEPEEDDTREDLKKWCRKALKHIGKDVSFVSDTISEKDKARIHSALPKCLTADEVRAVFAYETAPVNSDPAIMELASALREAVKAANTVTTPPQYTVNLTAQMPQAGEPSVTVVVPQQEPPVVNVTNDVQPAPVTISPAPAVEVRPEINVEPRVEVKMPERKKRKAKVNRDAQGNISGIEEQ